MGNILITGASGFMGKALGERLSARSHQLVLLDSKSADLTKDSSLLKYNDLKYDLIFHLAAWTQAGDFCLHHRENSGSSTNRSIPIRFRGGRNINYKLN